jgi:hypothetical protein
MTCRISRFQDSCFFVLETFIYEIIVARGSMVPLYLIIYLRYAIKETDHTYVLFSI